MAKRGFGGLKASLRRLSGANMVRQGKNAQSLGMAMSVGGMFLGPGSGAILGLGGAIVAVGGALRTHRGYTTIEGARRIERIETRRAARAGVAKGAAGRSGKAMQRASVGGRRVASAAPSGANGSVKGYYRVQAGKSVFVSGYQRA